MIHFDAKSGSKCQFGWSNLAFRAIFAKLVIYFLKKMTNGAQLGSGLGADQVKTFFGPGRYIFCPREKKTGTPSPQKEVQISLAQWIQRPLRLREITEFGGNGWITLDTLFAKATVAFLSAVLPSWHIWMVAFAIYLILWSIHYYINKPTNFENLCHEKRSLRKLVFGKQFTVNVHL